MAELDDIAEMQIALECVLVEVDHLDAIAVRKDTPQWLREDARYHATQGRALAEMLRQRMLRLGLPRSRGSA